MGKQKVADFDNRWRGGGDRTENTVRVYFGILCNTKATPVMMPSVPSFCTPGRPLKNLSVTSLPKPTLRNL